MIDEISCSTTCFKFDPLTPSKIVIVGCTGFARDINVGSEMIEVLGQEADLPSDLKIS